jgi:hypothetical protein
MKNIVTRWKEFIQIENYESNASNEIIIPCGFILSEPKGTLVLQISIDQCANLFLGFCKF